MLFNRDLLSEFIWFIKERHTIYRKRFLYRLPPPWTEDPLMQRYKFCNIYRELDAGSDWILQYCRKRCQTKVEKLFSLIVFRSINNFKIFKPVGNIDFVRFNGNCNEFINKIRKRMEKYNVWNSPYDPVVMKGKYIDSYSEIVNKSQNEEMLYEALLKDDWNSFCEFLKSRLGRISRFTLFQIAVDACLLEIVKFGNNSIDYVGIGAEKMLNEMFIDFEGDGEKKLRRLSEIVNESIQGFVAQPLTITNVEHCLCEFRKYKERQKSSRKRMFLFKPREDSHPDYSFQK